MKCGLLCLVVAAMMVPNDAMAQVPQKAVLLVIHADWCPPCRKFDSTWSSDREFRDALQDAFEVRELDWDVPAQRAQAILLGVTQLPTYIVKRNDRVVAKSVGFTISNSQLGQAKAKLMQDLRVEWPRPRRQAPEPVRPQPSQPMKPAPPLVDHAARDEIGRLNLQLRESRESTQSELRSITERIRETIERSLQQAQPVPESKPDLPDTAEPPAAAPRVSPGSSPPVPARDSSEIRSKWLNVLAAAGKVALTVAAPEVALPAGAGLSVLGGAIAWDRRRRQQKAARVPQLGTRANPITITEPAQVRTETKYVVHETDMLGEAYREGIRRVGNAYRENRPDIIEILKQVDAAADQICHGQRMARRPQTAQVSENAP